MVSQTRNYEMQNKPFVYSTSNIHYCCEDNYSCNISFPPSNMKIQDVCKGLHEAPEMQNKPFVYRRLRILQPIFRIFGHHQVYLWV